MVKKARELEIRYMEELQVLEDGDGDACMAETGLPPIPTDLVDINKASFTQTQLQKQTGQSRDTWTVNN